MICQDDRFLVIKRAAHVIAPGEICFPGGATRTGESDRIAVEREVREELGVECEVGKRLWSSVTPWDVALTWWRVELPDPTSCHPNALEVAWVAWLTLGELTSSPDLLESNRQFLEAIERGEILSPLDR